MSSPKKFKSCCYCGKNGIRDKVTITYDHIPPQSFLTPEEKQKYNLITVPACMECHQDLSTIDETVKFMHTICIARLEKQADHFKFMESARRTIKENKTYTTVLKEAKTILALDTNMILMPHVKIKFPLNFWDDFNKFFTRLSQALYYRETKLRLKANIFNVFILAGFDFNRPIDIFEEYKKIEFLEKDLIPIMQKRNYINGAFSYLYAKTIDRQDSCSFIYILRESLVVSVFCNVEYPY